MTLEIGMMLGIILLAIVLFSLDKISPDVTGLGIVLLIIVTGLLPVDVAFSSFGSETVLMILGLLILTSTMIKVGVVDLIGKMLLSRTNSNANRFVILMMVAAAFMSAFMSNTGATAFFLPIVISISRQLKESPSKYLMPLAFSSIIASSVTLIGTSTNLVISGILTEFGQEPLGLFELTAVGLPILIIGLLYMATIGIRLIPDRGIREDYTNEFEIQPYISELEILPNSQLIGQPINQAFKNDHIEMMILSVIRDQKRFLVPSTDVVLMQADLLLVEAHRDYLLEVQNKIGVRLRPQKHMEDEVFESKEVGMFEVVLLPRSPMIGRTLKDLKFRKRYGLQVLGISRNGQKIFQRVDRTRLSAGDQLLLQGNRKNVTILDRENMLRLIRPVEWGKIKTSEAVLSAILFVGPIFVSALGLAPFSVAVLIGAVLAFLTRAITPEEAYRNVDWKVLILIGSMLAVGKAMQATGTAEFIANSITSFPYRAGPGLLLAGFFTISLVLTQPMSNQAAAAVIVPVAIQTALQLGLNPRTFAVMIAIGASSSFLSPLEPACMLVFGPGNYKFMDFPRVGLILTVLIFIIAIILVPIIWPF